MKTISTHKYIIRLFQLLILSLIAVTVISCMKELDSSADAATDNTNEVISVTQAKVFFEQSFINSSSRASAVQSSRPGLLSPGDFTPLWNEATTSSNDKIGAVEVPLITT